jgi:ribosome recycling factor
MASEEYKSIELKMQKAIATLKDDLNGLRAGRANPAIVEKLNVEYYGVSTPINQIGNISVPEARVILIQPWDASLLKEVEKAILKSDIGINPSNDGKIIRLVFPQLTEERRKELTKVTKKHGEECKVAVRSIRRDAVEEYKVMKKDGDITEDDLKDAEKDIQKITDKYIVEVDKVIDAKDKEIMEI